MSIHLHLWTSHAAAVGALATLAVLVAALISRSETVFKLGCGFVLATAAAAVVSYFTGPRAFELLKAADPSVETPLIEDHAVFGKAAFVILMLVGVIDLGAIMQYLQGQSPSKIQRWSILIGMIVSAAVLIWAAHLGGLIRHSEIRPG